jgi:hypothetical protein
MHPFGRQRSNPFSSRRAPQQMTLLDNFFSPMRMSVFDQDSFAGDFGENNMGRVSSFNISFGFVDFSFSISNIRLFLEMEVVRDHYQRERANQRK